MIDNMNKLVHRVSGFILAVNHEPSHYQSPSKLSFFLWRLRFPRYYQEAAAIDWSPNESGFVNLSLGGATVTNPILLFNYADPVVQTFDFADDLSLSLLDQSPANSVTIESGNVVTTDGSASNSANDGFALQLNGTFSSISFQTNVNEGISDSLGFSLFAENSNVEEEEPVATPEPSSLLGYGIIFGIGSLLQRKNRSRNV